MEGCNVSHKLFIHLFFIICLSNELLLYFISTNNYVNAYKELRKERQVAAEDVEYIYINIRGSFRRD